MVLNALSKLQPRDFENLAFDLLQSAGLRNMVWRTPGVDGGRDIEGIFILNDLSGAITIQKWYVECKRYSSAVDWPTVWGKVAYADNHGADYLLLITNNNPSPQCETQISAWNAQRRRVQVRVWRGYEMERILEGYPAIATKYGLRDKPAPIDIEFLPLLTEVTKVAQASYTALELDGNPLPGLEVAASISELISLRMAQVRARGRIFTADASTAVPGYTWLNWTGPVEAWETAGLRAFLSAYRCFIAAEALNVTASQEGARLVPVKGRGRLTPAVQTSLANIAMWSDIEIGPVDEGTLSMTIRPRQVKI